MIWDDFVDGYGLHRFRIYVQLANNTDLEVLNAKFEPFLRNVMKFDIPSRIVLQKIEDIHLHSEAIGDTAPRGSITMVYVLSSVAILILLLM